MGDVTTCPKCGNPECALDDYYCFNCGADLGNYCSNENCVMNDEDEDEERRLNRNYCFCPVCGSKTTHMQAGYIKPQEFVL